MSGQSRSVGEQVSDCDASSPVGLRSGVPIGKIISDGYVEINSTCFDFHRDQYRRYDRLGKRGDIVNRVGFDCTSIRFEALFSERMHPKVTLESNCEHAARKCVNSGATFKQFVSGFELRVTFFADRSQCHWNCGLAETVADSHRWHRGRNADSNFPAEWNFAEDGAADRTLAYVRGAERRDPSLRLWKLFDQIWAAETGHD